MKQRNLTIAGFILLAGFTACNGDKGTNSTTGPDSTTMKSGDTSNAMNNGSNTMSGGDSANKSSTATTTPTTTSKMPLSKVDSMFVMKAAAGGMMEVQGGNLAQTNAMSDRVKGFGMMMVNDHTKANQELASIASSKGLTVPTDLPPAMKKMAESMAKMKGKDFDGHYMTMMVSDHKEDIADFEKATKSTDPDISAFATKTLPVLKMHLDSATAIHKMKM